MILHIFLIKITKKFPYIFSTMHLSRNLISTLKISVLLNHGLLEFQATFCSQIRKVSQSNNIRWNAQQLLLKSSDHSHFYTKYILLYTSLFLIDIEIRKILRFLRLYHFIATSVWILSIPIVKWTKLRNKMPQWR